MNFESTREVMERRYGMRADSLEWEGHDFFFSRVWAG